MPKFICKICKLEHVCKLEHMHPQCPHFADDWWPNDSDGWQRVTSPLSASAAPSRTWWPMSALCGTADTLLDADPGLARAQGPFDPGPHDPGAHGPGRGTDQGTDQTQTRHRPRPNSNDPPTKSLVGASSQPGSRPWAGRSTDIRIECSADACLRGFSFPWSH